jgi:sporulation protein YlmC with PRC-barrel domain
MTLRALAIAAVLLVMPLAVPAAGNGAVRQTQPLSTVAGKAQDVRATELIGQKTVDVRGEPLGRVEDVLVAKNGGTHYAVLSFAHALGLDNKLYTYPLGDLAPGRTSGEVLIQAERKALLEQAGNQMLGLALRLFDPNALFSDPPFMRVSALLGRTVDYGSLHAGVIEDVALNLASGRLRYVVAHIGGKRFALPPTALAAVDNESSSELPSIQTSVRSARPRSWIKPPTCIADWGSWPMNRDDWWTSLYKLLRRFRRAA